MNIVPIIAKIVEYDEIYYALNEDEEILFGTSIKEIADMYFTIPKILEEQAGIIQKLSDRLNSVTDEYNTMLMGIIPSGSSIVH